jgi:hypothetical protein
VRPSSVVRTGASGRSVSVDVMSSSVAASRF